MQNHESGIFSITDIESVEIDDSEKLYKNIIDTKKQIQNNNLKIQILQSKENQTYNKQNTIYKLEIENMILDIDINAAKKGEFTIHEIDSMDLLNNT